MSSLGAYLFLWQRCRKKNQVFVGGGGNPYIEVTKNNTFLFILHIILINSGILIVWQLSYYNLVLSIFVLVVYIGLYAILRRGIEWK